MNTEHRRHDDHDKSKRNGDRAMARMAPYALSAILGGGSFSVGMPMLWPELYRDDPATGTELREVQNDVRQLETQITVQLVAGLNQIAKNQEQIIELIKDMGDVQSDMRLRQERHFNWQENHQQ